MAGSGKIQGLALFLWLNENLLNGRVPLLEVGFHFLGKALVCPLGASLGPAERVHGGKFPFKGASNYGFPFFPGFQEKGLTKWLFLPGHILFGLATFCPRGAI